MDNTLSPESSEALRGYLSGIAPVISVNNGVLGGSSLFVLISLDPKESWANGILENSRYARFSIRSARWLNRKKENVSGFEVEQFSGSFTFLKGRNFRKVKVETLLDVASKIRYYVETFPRFEDIALDVAAFGGMNAWQTAERKAAGQFFPWEQSLRCTTNLNKCLVLS